jgi:hypothetical protein
MGGEMLEEGENAISATTAAIACSLGNLGHLEKLSRRDHLSAPIPARII